MTYTYRIAELKPDTYGMEELYSGIYGRGFIAARNAAAEIAAEADTRILSLKRQLRE